jgi:hypothetical protein
MNALSYPANHAALAILLILFLSLCTLCLCVEKSEFGKLPELYGSRLVLSSCLLIKHDVSEPVEINDFPYMHSK